MLNSDPLLALRRTEWMHVPAHENSVAHLRTGADCRRQTTVPRFLFPPSKYVSEAIDMPAGRRIACPLEDWVLRVSGLWEVSRWVLRHWGTSET